MHFRRTTQFVTEPRCTGARRLLRALTAAAVGAVALAGLAMPAAGQELREEALRPGQYLPPELKEARTKAGVDEQLGTQVPTDLRFTDSAGQERPLSDFLVGNRPVLLQLAYYRCPMLCGQISQGMITSLKDLDAEIGKDYEVLTISFDSREETWLAMMNKEASVKKLDAPGAAEGWEFFTGDDLNIQKLADAVGFRFAWIESAQEYSHPAVLMVLTPEGKVSRYLYGTSFDPQTLRLSLIEASQGTIQPTLGEKIFLNCFAFDPSSGKYTMTAMTLMQIAGVTTVLALSGIIGLLLVSERRRTALQVGANAAPDVDTPADLSGRTPRA